jgi:hypothetical protein
MGGHSVSNINVPPALVVIRRKWPWLQQKYGVPWMVAVCPAEQIRPRYEPSWRRAAAGVTAAGVTAAGHRSVVCAADAAGGGSK